MGVCTSSLIPRSGLRIAISQDKQRASPRQDTIIDGHTTHCVMIRIFSYTINGRFRCYFFLWFKVAKFERRRKRFGKRLLKIIKCFKIRLLPSSKVPPTSPPVCELSQSYNIILYFTIFYTLFFTY